MGYECDAYDNISKGADVLGYSMKYTWNAAGQLLEETAALGNVTRYEYTPEGWLSNVTRADGSQISYTYDALGNLLEQKYDGENVEWNTWDNQCNLVSAENKSGKIDCFPDRWNIRRI